MHRPQRRLFSARSAPFHGHRVVRAAFTIAVFGWGFGFYGPPIFLHAVMLRTGWPLQWVSAGMSMHFLAGAVVVVCLPWLHARYGLPAVTCAGALLLALGTLGWAQAAQPWQLFAAAIFSGGGWATLGAAALNAMVSPWFARGRPMALAKAYNGASLGGMLMAPLWVSLTAQRGFTVAAVLLGLLMLTVVSPLALLVLRHTPASLGQLADDALPVARGAPPSAVSGTPGRRARLWRNPQFLTLAVGMALGLFAQLGLVAQLYALMAPALGALLFGLGIGNATSLPPLIAQAEFAKEDVPRVVARSVALSQGLYAFAPAAFAWVLGWDGDTGRYFSVLLDVQLAAMACMLAGRNFAKARG
jgi:MFS family permease